MLLLLVFILIFIGILNTQVSSKLTSMMSLQTPNEKISTLKDLTNSNKKVLFMNFLLGNKNLVNEDVDQIVERSMKEKTVIEWRDFLTDDKWINGVTDGRYAVFMFEVPLKQLLVRSTQLRPTQSKEQINYFHIEEYVKRIQTPITLRRQLDKEVRIAINHR